MNIFSDFSKKRKVVFSIILVLLVCTLAFIWWHSAQPGYESKEESTGILALIKPVLALIVGEELATDHLVRKLAHFAEFAVLGIELISLFIVMKKALLRSSFFCAAFSLAVAIIDEIIQLFPVGRNASVGDVLLDFSGSVFGIAFFAFMFFIISKRKSRSV